MVVGSEPDALWHGSDHGLNSVSAEPRGALERTAEERVDETPVEAVCVVGLTQVRVAAGGTSRRADVAARFTAGRIAGTGRFGVIVARTLDGVRRTAAGDGVVAGAILVGCTDADGTDDEADAGATIGRGDDASVRTASTTMGVPMAPATATAAAPAPVRVVSRDGTSSQSWVA